MLYPKVFFSESNFFLLVHSNFSLCSSHIVCFCLKSVIRVWMTVSLILIIVMLDNMKCCDVLASRHWPFNNRMPHVWLHSSGLVSRCCSAVELSHHQRLLYSCLGQTSNSTKTKLDAQIWKHFVVAFQEKQMHARIVSIVSPLTCYFHMPPPAEQKPKARPQSTAQRRRPGWPPLSGFPGVPGHHVWGRHADRFHPRHPGSC